MASITRRSYRVHEIVPYINWDYFFHAWRTSDGQSPELKRDALRLLEEADGWCLTHAVVGLFPANGNGDDIVIVERRGNGQPTQSGLPMLRQQHGDTCLCWADFLPPMGQSPGRMGMFATSVDARLEESHPEDDYRHLLAQTVADRLAEATAERMHEEVRRSIWGYAPDERLTPKEMFQEKYIGRRPAVGYPSLPDQSTNFLIDQFIDMCSIGIQLTESGAMRPHASTSGLLFAHPQARHFAIGRIGDDQLHDYARRRGFPEAEMRRFLAANLS